MVFELYFAFCGAFSKCSFKTWFPCFTQSFEVSLFSNATILNIRVIVSMSSEWYILLSAECNTLKYWFKYKAIFFYHRRMCRICQMYYRRATLFHYGNKTMHISHCTYVKVYFGLMLLQQFFSFIELYKWSINEDPSSCLWPWISKQNTT